MDFFALFDRSSSKLKQINGIKKKRTTEDYTKQFFYLVNHVFLPNKLNGSQEDNNGESEADFLKCVKNVLETMSKLEFAKREEKKFEEIKRHFKQWDETQGSEFLDGSQVHKAIKSLRKNQAAAFYLRANNACFIVKLTNKDQYTISSFEPSANNQTVLSADADLPGIYPLFTVNVNDNDTLCSKSFAEQLACLANTTTIYGTAKKAGVELVEVHDVPNPKYAFDWIPSVLMPNDSSATVANATKVVKKIRDDIVYSTHSHPFRRSGMWTSIKTVLQIRLYDLYGEIEGKVVYKIIIALVHNQLCMDSLYHNLDADLKLQMIKKLARRLYKIEELIKESGLDTSDYSECFEMISKTIETVKDELDENFKTVSDSSRSNPASIEINEINYADIVHKNISSLISQINFKKKLNANKLNGIPKAPECPNRHLSTDIPDSGYQSYSKDSTIAHLYDIEYWIESIHLDNVNATESFNSFWIIELMDKYINMALSFYSNDPIGNSRTILSCMKLVCILDKLATNEFPLLNEHEIGFDIKPLESLLLPRSSDMIYSQSIKEYIEKRNRNAQYKSIIDTSNINEDSFSARYGVSKF